MEQMGNSAGMEDGSMPEGPEIAAQVETFKRMVADGKVTREEVTELRKMYKEMNMDLDDMVNQTKGIEDTLDPQVRQVALAQVERTAVLGLSACFAPACT